MTRRIDSQDIITPISAVLRNNISLLRWIPTRIQHDVHSGWRELLKLSWHYWSQHKTPPSTTRHLEEWTHKEKPGCQRTWSQLEMTWAVAAYIPHTAVCHGNSKSLFLVVSQLNPTHITILGIPKNILLCSHLSSYHIVSICQNSKFVYLLLIPVLYTVTHCDSQLTFSNLHIMCMYTSSNGSGGTSAVLFLVVSTWNYNYCNNI
jgi:hypothetical protein